MNPYVAAMEAFNAGRFDEADARLGRLLQLRPDPFPALRPDLEGLRGLCAFQLGRYREAQQLLEKHAERQPDWSEALARIDEQLGTPARAGTLAYREQMAWGARQSELRRLPERWRGELVGKLARRDLVAHAFYGLKALRQVELLPVSLAQPGWAECELMSALEFFRRELAAGCPKVEVLPVIHLDPGPAALERDWGAMDRVGWCHQQLGRNLPQRRRVVVFQEGGEPFSCGVARHAGRLSWVEMGHHRGHRALVTAHELAHLLFDLPDISETFDCEDRHSLLGQWEGPLEAAYLGMRFRAGLLTPKTAQRQIDRALAAEKRGEFAWACDRLEQAWGLDPWHLGLSLSLVRLAMVVRRRSLAERVAEQARLRWGCLDLELRLAELLKQEHIDAQPQDLSPAARETVGRWHLSGGRPQLAGRYLEGEETPSWLAAQALHQLRLWRLAQALELLERAVAAAPFHSKLRELLGSTLIRLGRIREGREQLKQARRLQGSARVPAHEFQLAWQQRRWQSALARVGEILKYNQDQAFFWSCRGLLEWRLGHDPTSSLGLACRLEPTLLQRSYRAWSRGQLELAQSLAERARSHPEQRLPALELLGHLQPQGGSWGELERRLPTYVGVFWP